MSKQRDEKPRTGASTEPVRTAPQEAAPQKTVPRTDKPPQAPGHLLAFARIIGHRYGVPEWLVLLAAWAGSRYGTATLATHNWTGRRARGTEMHNGQGIAWYNTMLFCIERFGLDCHQLGLDYGDPKACVDALKELYPEITTATITDFTEV